LADNAAEMVTLDGSRGEGGGQILRTALSLSLLTGRPFRITKIRANRDKPGLRPQHLAAVEAAAALCGGKVTGATVGARELVFRPRPYVPRDLDLDIGTAGATALVLHTLALPIALRAEGPVRLTLAGGTFNDRAPSFPFLETTWRGYLATLGLSVGLAMPSAGFYPVGGGRLEAWIEPGQPHPFVLTERGPLRQIRGVSGVSNLHRHAVAERMAEQARSRLSDLGLDAKIALADWPGRAQGAAIALTAEHDVPGSARPISSTFVGLGARGKPAERVADEAVDELLAYLDAPGAGAVDPHSADQLLLPLALAEGTSVFTVSDVTEHLRTNAATIRAFLDRDIRIDEPDDDRPGRVIVA
jgi:RNA 3'-terminal phosphate cyclase (ATP)